MSNKVDIAVRRTWPIACLLILALASASLLVVPGHTQDPARFSCLKELGFLFFMLSFAIVLVLQGHSFSLDGLDLLLLALCSVALISFVVRAENKYAALPQAGLLVSGTLFFLVSRSFSNKAIRRPVIQGVGVVVTLVALIGVLQAYGVEFSYYAGGATPGATFGNRNRAAHFLVIALPTVAASVYRAPKFSRSICTVGLITATALIFISRTRAAWIALAVEGLTALWLFILWYRSTGLPRRQVFMPVIGLSIALGIACSNRLDWRSSTPYIDSVRTLFSIGSGSGKARLIQQRTTVRMILANPILGVGPGNWSVSYGRYASTYDPSYDLRRPAPTPRLPRGDWLGMAAEMGLAAAALLLAITAWLIRHIRDRVVKDESRVDTLVLVSTLAAIVVLGFSDPVLMTPESLALSAIVVALPLSRGQNTLHLGSSGAWLLAAGFAIALSAPAVYAARRVWASHIKEKDDSMTTLAQAAAWDPGDFGARYDLAAKLRASGRCREAIPYALDASQLMPTSLATKHLLKDCASSLKIF